MGTATRGLLALGAAVALAGCGDPAGQALGPGENAVVTVGEGVSPLYSWAGARARRLVVSEVSTGQVAWDIQALDGNVGFPSPVEHGLIPEGAREVVAARLLQTGVRYRVSVARITGGDAGAEFIP